MPSPLSAQDLGRLQDIIRQRRAVFQRHGDMCRGHKFWIDLLQSVHGHLEHHNKSSAEAQSEAGAPRRINDVADDSENAVAKGLKYPLFLNVKGTSKPEVNHRWDILGQAFHHLRGHSTDH